MRTLFDSRMLVPSQVTNSSTISRSAPGVSSGSGASVKLPRLRDARIGLALKSLAAGLHGLPGFAADHSRGSAIEQHI